MEKYSKLKDRAFYDKVLGSGLFFELFPELSGIWKDDLPIICGGLYDKYIIKRTDGKIIEADERFFVLKIEGNGDSKHIDASRKALLCYAKEIASHLPKLASDIFEKYK